MGYLGLVAGIIFVSVSAIAEEPKGFLVDSLLARVGREAVLLSDLERFMAVNKVLDCAGVVKRVKPLPADRKAALDTYIEEELLYLDARARKISTAGSIPRAVRAIHEKESCKSAWQKLGREYSKIWRTETRRREGESLLVRELEKRVLVEKFRQTELITDGELWQREAKVRHPVKIHMEP
jgi:hypothetical protein